MKPRLLVLTSTYPRWAGDTEPGFVHELSRRLTDNFEVTVLAPHAPGSRISEEMDGVQVRRFRYAPGRFEQLAYEGGISERLRHQRWRLLLVPVFLLCQLWATWRLMRRLKPAVIHAHWIFPQAFVAALVNLVSRRTIPILCTVHGADWYRLRGRFWQRIKGWTLQRCQVIAPVSAVLRREIETTVGGGSKLVRPMPMGIDIPDFVTPMSERAPCSLFFVGRLAAKKGLDVLLQAMVLLKQVMPQVQLVIAGDGENRSYYQRNSVACGLVENVTFLGAISHAEVYTQMQQSGLCVVPSLRAEDGDQEGLGLVLLEALACGCQVVASDIPVFRSLLSEAAQGHLFRSGDSEALARKLETLLSDKHDLVLTRPTMLDAYSWRVSALRYQEVIADMANNPTTSY